MAPDTAKPNTETGIKLHAASGSVVTASNTGATRLTASGAIDVSSTKTNVLVASPTQVLLAAAGAALRIDSGSITINAPGAVEFKAGMKNLTSGANASAPGLSLGKSDLTLPSEQARFSLQVDLADLIGMHPQSEIAVQPLPYEIRKKDGTVLAKGITNSQGDTGRVFTNDAEDVYIYIGDGVCTFSVDCKHEVLGEA